MSIYNSPLLFAKELEDSILRHALGPETDPKIQDILQNWRKIPQKQRSYALSEQFREISVRIETYNDDLAAKIQEISKEVLPKNPKTLLDELCPGYRENPAEAVARLDYSQLEAFIKHIDKLDILSDQADDRLLFCYNLIEWSDRRNRTWAARTLVWHLEKFRLKEHPLQDRLTLYDRIAEQGHAAAGTLALRFEYLGLEAADEGARFKLCQKIVRRGAGHHLAKNFQKVRLSNRSHRLALAKLITEQDDFEARSVLQHLEYFALGFEEDAERFAFFQLIITPNNRGSKKLAAEYLAKHIDQLGFQELSYRVALFKEIANLGESSVPYALFDNIKKLGLAEIDMEERITILNEITSINSLHVWYRSSKILEECGFIRDIRACEEIKGQLALCHHLVSQGEWLAEGLIRRFDQLGLKKASFQERLSLCNAIFEKIEFCEHTYSPKMESFIEDIQNCRTAADRLTLCCEMVQQAEWAERYLTFSFEKLGFIRDVRECQTTAERLTLCCEIVQRSEWGAIGLARNFSLLKLKEASIEERLRLIRLMIEKSEQCAPFLASSFHDLGLETAPLQERHALCREFVLRGGAPLVARHFETLGLENIPQQDRLALCHLIVENDGALDLPGNFEKFGLEKTTLQERLQLCEKITAQGTNETHQLRWNFEKFGTDPEKRKMLLELLIPPHFFDKGLLDLPFLGDITPLVAILTKEEDEDIELSEFAALRQLIPPFLVEFFSKVHGEKNPHVKFQLTQWLASCAAVLSNRDPDYHTALEKSGILDDLFRYRNPMNRFAVTKHLRTLRNMPPEAKKKKWSRISWVLLSKMQEIGFSEESAQLILSQINHKSHSGRVFTGPARFNHLLQLLLKVIEAQPYKTNEIDLISQATVAILRQRGRSTQEKDAICIQLQMLTNILNLFGREALINCLELKKDGEVFFREKLEELLGIEEMDDFGKRYQDSFGSFRDPMALFTYIRTNRELPEVLEALSVYVNGVLKEEFPAIRYATHLNPHLKMLFERDPGLKAMWLKSPIESTTLESVGAVEEVDYKQFFKNKILVDKHLNPADLPQLCSYLKTGTIVSADPFQTLAIQLCEGEIKAQDFVSRVRELPINLGEFQNDLQSLLPQRSFGQYTLSESDDPCDLLLIGTEIRGSCQRVCSPASKTLVSYLMNGEIRPIVVKSGGKLIARSLLRLMWDDTNETPLLLMERIYSNVIDPSVDKAIQDWAKAKAGMMQIPLVSQEVGSGAPYAGSVNFLGGFAPYVYSDASGGSLAGPFETKGCHCLFQPHQPK